jgi:hypothetical protein
MTSRNNRSAEEAALPRGPAPGRQLTRQWNTRRHVAHVNRGSVFCGSAPRLYKESQLWWSWESAVCSVRVRGWREMVASLRGHEPGARGTSSVGSNVTENTVLCVILSWEIDASSEEHRSWGAVARQRPVKTQRLIRLSACCSQL